MTVYLLPTPLTLLGKKNGVRGFIAVISVVVPRASYVSCSWRLLAKFRRWREGTDPALRGRKGRWGAWQVRGGTV